MPIQSLKRFKKRWKEHIHLDAKAGILMMLAMMIALGWASSPWAASYEQLLKSSLGMAVGSHVFSLSIDLWVQDVLMVLFFFQVGMDLKQEYYEGVLSDRRQIMLPMVAAVFGMLVPALIFLGVTFEHPELWRGAWIPSATDIAFAMCLYHFIGKKLPPALRIFLLALAIFDDLGAILIIAFFYGSVSQLSPFLWVGAGVLSLWLLNYFRVRALWAYAPVAIFSGVFLHHAGIHTTLIGVITGFAIPLHRKTEEGASYLEQCIHTVHPWVALGVLPLFAFANSGVDLTQMSWQESFHPLTLGLTLGLILGKPLGIFLPVYVLVRLGWLKLPKGCSWGHIFLASLLAGIGFTMSLFIGFLAFEGDTWHHLIKMGVLKGSLLSALGAILFIRGFRGLLGHEVKS